MGLLCGRWCVKVTFERMSKIQISWFQIIPPAKAIACYSTDGLWPLQVTPCIFSAGDISASEKLFRTPCVHFCPCIFSCSLASLVLLKKGVLMQPLLRQSMRLCDIQRAPRIWSGSRATPGIVPMVANQQSLWGELRAIVFGQKESSESSVWKVFE